MSSLVSVVIPNYNNERYLRDCLDSILRQTHPEVEIVIVDDASSDSSLDIISGYKNENINVIVNKGNLGVSRSRHIAIMRANGKYITSLDSDDYYLSDNKISSELEKIESDKDKYGDKVIAFSGISIVDNESNVKSVSSNIYEGEIFDRIITRDCMIPRDFMFTRKQYMEAGGFDHDIPIYEDWDLKIRLAKNNLFLYTGQEGIAYRRHGQGLSSVDIGQHIKWLSHIFNKNRDLIDPNKQYAITRKFRKNCLDPLERNYADKTSKLVHIFNRLIEKIWKKN